MEYYSPLFPNPVTCFVSILTQYYQELINRLPNNGIWPWLQESWEWHYVSFYFGLSELTHVILFALGLSILRIILNYFILKPIPGYFKLSEENVHKFPESAWKSIIYIITWFWALYLCCVSEEQYFFNLNLHWEGYAPGQPVYSSVYWLYMLQIGFYVHCAYASVFVETVRRDFILLMIHHVITIALLTYSYGVRFHLIGLLVLFIQDIGDVSLETTKTVLYFKIRNGKDYAFPEHCANVGFAFFTFQWILFRLYWYFTKVLYSSGYVSMQVYPYGPFYLSFNTLLMILYCMQVYWFTMIVNLLIKIIVTGGKVEDTREIKNEPSSKTKKT